MEGTGISGLSDWLEGAYERAPILQELSWVDLLITLGMVFEKESASAHRPGDSPRLRQLAERGYDYDQWLHGIELLLESAFPRQAVIHRLKLKGRRFKSDHIREALGLLWLARKRARAERLLSRALRGVSWSAGAVRRFVFLSWVALVYLLPLSTAISLLVVWLGYVAASLVEILSGWFSRYGQRRALILRPPVRPGRFVLYLRSFKSDEYVTSSRMLPLQHLASPLPFLWPGRPLVDRITRALEPIGPVFALGWSEEDPTVDTLELPVLALPNEKWQERAIEAARDAALILIDAGRLSGGGHAWEIGRILEGELLHKTIFLLPYDSPTAIEDMLENLAGIGNRPPDWVPPRRLATFVGLRQMDPARIRYQICRHYAFPDFSLTLPDYDPDALFLYFDLDRVAHLVPCRRDEARTTAEPRACVPSLAEAAKLLERAFPKFRQTQTDRSVLVYKALRLALLASCQFLLLGLARWLK